MDRPPLELPRHVRPRKRTQRAADLNIITVTRDGVTSEHATGAAGATDLPALVKAAPPSLIACFNHMEIFRLLDDTYKGDPAWDWQISVQQKALRGDSRFTVEDVSLTLAGWKGKGHKRGRWHHFLDPNHFADGLAWPGDLDLYQFACDVRAFLAAHELHPTARAGGIAAQLLRHPDIYEQPRRQVPRFINEQARRALPGNHYQFVDGAPREEYPDVWYMDQEAAHHNITRQIALPHADQLVAVGRSRVHDKHENPDDRVWLAGDRMGDFLKWQPKGLLYCRLKLTDTPNGMKRNGFDPAPSWYQNLLRDTTGLAYLFTNELDALPIYGVQIDYLIAGWVSTARDDCLPFYAEWALHTTRHATGIRRIWLKPTLHAVYGMLAAKTTRVEFVRKQGRGKTRTVATDTGPIHGMSSGPRTFVPKISNVIQRGMIEAETRKRSCLLALSLRDRGYNVLSIYADGVIVESKESEGDQPPVPLRLGGDGWRAKDRLTHLKYTDETHYLSAELVKWPGTSPPTRREQHGHRGHRLAREGGHVTEVQRAGRRRSA